MLEAATTCKQQLEEFEEDGERTETDDDEDAKAPIVDEFYLEGVSEAIVEMFNCSMN